MKSSWSSWSFHITSENEPIYIYFVKITITRIKDILHCKDFCVESVCNFSNPKKLYTTQFSLKQICHRYFLVNICQWTSQRWSVCFSFLSLIR
uniref:Uncharacterized protein n=1 Tax=Gasterosteus aculeatus TaxID=69293 RepID=G3Q8Z5_GASAC